jgi:hypothetical protein
LDAAVFVDAVGEALALWPEERDEGDDEEWSLSV